MRLPSTAALQCFLSAARLDSFTAAARELGLTHGAVSRQVSSLEEQLGIVLFDRIKQRIRLTSAGKQFLSDIEPLVAGLEQAAQRARELPARDKLVIACDPVLAIRWLIPRLPSFAREFPEAQIQVLACQEAVVSPADRRGADIAVRLGDANEPASAQGSGLFCTPLMVESIGPVVGAQRSADNAWWNQAHLLCADLENSWQTWAALDGRAARKPKRKYQFTDIHSALQAAVAGLGTAIAPYALVIDDLANNLLLAPEGFQPSARHYIASCAFDRAQEPAIMQAMAWLQNQAAQSDPSDWNGSTGEMNSALDLPN